MTSWKMVAALCALLLPACALLQKPASKPPHRELEPAWRQYVALPSERALAIAGELRHNRWVAGMTGGNPTSADAEANALAECGRRRQLRRIEDPCRVYALGDEIVWEGP